MSVESVDSKISEAEETLEALKKLKKPVVERFEADANTLKPKVVWKYDGFMQAALYRITDIADDALLMWRKSKLISSVILARSLMETGSAAYWLAKRVVRNTNEGDLGKADKEVSDLSFASRNTPEFPEAKSILTYIDAVDKLVPGYRAVYDILSEASHPNHMGTLWAYSALNKDAYEVTFFDSHPDTEEFLETNMPAALSGSLFIMHIALNDYGTIRPALVELGQEDLRKHMNDKK